MELIISPCESTEPARPERRHLRLVPTPAELEGDADVAAGHDGDVEPERPLREEDLALPVAAVLAVPNL